MERVNKRRDETRNQVDEQHTQHVLGLHELAIERFVVDHMGRRVLDHLTRDVEELHERGPLLYLEILARRRGVLVEISEILRVRDVDLHLLLRRAVRVTDDANDASQLLLRWRRRHGGEIGVRIVDGTEGDRHLE